MYVWAVRTSAQMVIEIAFHNSLSPPIRYPAETDTEENEDGNMLCLNDRLGIIPLRHHEERFLYIISSVMKSSFLPEDDSRGG